MSQRLHRLFKLASSHYQRMQKVEPILLPPVLDSLSPDTVVSGDSDFTLSCIGSGFTWETIIKFGQYDEPTTLISPTEVTTIVKPSLFVPDTVPVQVHNRSLSSEVVNFTFTASGTGTEERSDRRA
jgi:hypothetical protein